MELNNGSVDLTILSVLYREPIRENELERDMGFKRASEFKAALSRLLRKALVMDITKDSNGPIYKLTRKGMKVLESLVVEGIGRPMIVT